jgi:hypothetical protein
MSLSAQQARLFLTPLQNKATIFLVADRHANLLLGKLILSSLVASGSSCVILDTDAFYASNSAMLTSAVPKPDLKNLRLYIPKVGTSGQGTALELFKECERRTVMIDNLNSFYHALSSENRSSAGRKLNFLVALLSFLGHTNNMTALITVYEREKPTITRHTRSFSGLGDVSISTHCTGSRMVLRCESGTAWPDGTLSFSIPTSGEIAVCP